MDLQDFVDDFARAIAEVDAHAPQAFSVRDGKPYQPGIGPHTEPATVELVLRHLNACKPELYRDRHALQVPYPASPRSRCDLCLGTAPNWQWSIEIKMLRLMGDNGKPNDNILMHILSPYPAHRSALTDTEKLLSSGLAGRKAVVIYAYEYDKWPAKPATQAFETLASARVRLTAAIPRQISNLVHPVHRAATVWGYEVAAIA